MAKQNLTLCIATVLMMLLSATLPADAGLLQRPAAQLSWEDWRLIGSCGGVSYWAALSAADGRNDFALKLKVDNQNTHAIQTRLNAVIHAENGAKRYRDDVGVGRLNAESAGEACSTIPSLCFGVLFPSAVTQKRPTQIAKLILTNVDVANIDAPPANASPAAYLDPYRDYPHTTCRDLSITFPNEASPRFVSLTDKCVNGLPKWTKPDCDDAVDEILKAFKKATSLKDQVCVEQWRDYQKCYEIYAFDANPLPRPSCERPACRIRNTR